jgi:uncharacterized protein (TIGR02599 family)
MAVLAVISVIMVSMVSTVQKVAKQTSSRVEQFRESRRAFDRIGQRLSQATLNTYYDYVDSGGNPRTTNNAASFNPSRYARISELRYLQTNAASYTAPRGGQMKGQTVFFQAPLGQANINLSGLDALLNTVGYYIEKGDDDGLRPPPVINAGLAKKDRYRLYECVQPTEDFTVYSLTSGAATNKSDTWVNAALTTNNTYPLAENIVALVFDAIYPNTNGIWTNSPSYSSAPRGNASQPIEENNLPPKVRVGMIAVDEPSARRIESEGISLTDPEDYSELETLEQDLVGNNLNYRRFESTVTIGPSKWSAK